MACVEVPITDDDLALEPDETFEVTLEAPAGIPTPGDPSTVTIIDNDGKTNYNAEAEAWFCSFAERRTL